jgi:alkyl sulfatase BDS1-like metallo-beta-lactamase superfamily hydrolase
MQRCQIDAKLLSEAKKYLSLKFKETEPQLRLWHDMITFLFGDKTMHLLNRNLTQSEILQAIRTKLSCY